MATQQVKNFYRVAKDIGLKRGDFTARSPMDRHGEYKDLEITIWVSLTEEQVRKLAQSYEVTLYKRDGVIGWNRPHVSQRRAGLFLYDLDECSERGLYKYSRIDN